MKIAEYIKETKGEMKHVSWPTRKQSLNYTLLVIVISIVTALLLSAFDYGFSNGLEALLNFKNSSPAPSISPEDVNVQVNGDNAATTEEASSTFKINVNQ